MEMHSFPLHWPPIYIFNNQEEGKKKAQCLDNVKHEAQPRRPWLSCQHWVATMPCLRATTSLPCVDTCMASESHALGHAHCL